MSLKKKNTAFSIMTVGVNDNLHLGEGWYERAVDGRSHAAYRPSKPEAKISLDLPGGDVEIVALLSGSVTLCGGVMRGGLFSLGKSLGTFTLHTDNWVIRRFAWKNAPSGRVEIIIRTDTPFIPNDVLKNGDYREMGVSLAALRAEPA